CAGLSAAALATGLGIGFGTAGTARLGIGLRAAATARPGAAAARRVPATRGAGAGRNPRRGTARPLGGKAPAPGGPAQAGRGRPARILGFLDDRVLLELGLEVEQVPDGILLDSLHHGVEQVVALALVLDQRVPLCHRP